VRLGAIGEVPTVPHQRKQGTKQNPASHAVMFFLSNPFNDSRLPLHLHSLPDDNPTERRYTNLRGSRHCPDLDTAFGPIIPVHSQDAHSSTSFSPAPRLLHLDLPRRHDTLGIVCGVAIKVSQRPGCEWWRIMSYMSAVSSCLLLVPVVLLVG